MTRNILLTPRDGCSTERFLPGDCLRSGTARRHSELCRYWQSLVTFTQANPDLFYCQTRQLQWEGSGPTDGHRRLLGAKAVFDGGGTALHKDMAGGRPTRVRQLHRQCRLSRTIKGAFSQKIWIVAVFVSYF